MNVIDRDRINELGFSMDELYKFARDQEGRFVTLESGWYQSPRGDLFKYDGVVWDNVPDCALNSLEYLG